MPTAQAKTKDDFFAQPKLKGHIRTRVDLLARITPKLYARTSAQPKHEV